MWISCSPRQEHTLRHPLYDENTINKSWITFPQHGRNLAWKGQKYTVRHLENSHPVGSMEDIMQILHATSMGPYTDVLMEFYIYEEPKKDIR
jgi:hypothetical protein